MVQRTGGLRRKTRHKLKKDIRSRGKISLSRYFQGYEIGEKVLLDAEPSYQKGMYMPRFHSKIGILKSRRGKCYEVAIKDQGKEKLILVHPLHIRKIQEQK